MADKVYEITSFTGLSDYEDRGIKGAFKFGSNLSVRKAIDSLSCNQDLKDEGLEVSKSPSLSVSPSLSQSSSISLSPSSSISPTPSPSSSVSASPSTTPSLSPSLSPSPTPSSSISLSPSPTSAQGTFQDLILWFVKCSDGYTYGFGNTGWIYRRDADGFWMIVYKTVGKIKGAEEKPSSNKKTYLYFATDTKLFRKEIPGLSNWNDVETVGQNLNSTDWHTMKQVGGALMIANGPWLAMVGYDNSYTNEALDIIPGNVCKTLVERNGRVIIGTYKEGFPLKGINGAIDSEVPLAQVGDDGEIYFNNMSNGLPVKVFPGGGIINPGGIASYIDNINFFEWEQNSLSWIDKQSIGNLAIFGVYNASSGKNGIYTYGRTNKNKPFVLNLDYKMDIDEIGAVVSVDGVIMASYRDGSDFGVKSVDSDVKAVGTYEGLDFKAPVKQPINITQWKTAEVFMSPLPSSCSVEFWYRVNKNGDFVRARTADGEAIFNKQTAKKAVFSIAAEGEIFEPRIVLNSSFNVCPEIHRVRIYFN